MAFLSVVVPVFNELEMLPLFRERIEAVLAQISNGSGGHRVELVFVDDGSTDGSYEWLAQYAKESAHVRVIKFSRNFGSYLALTAGLLEARGDAAVMVSADLQDPPELIPEMLRKWQEGVDVVWAVRRSRAQDPLLRQAASGAFYGILRRFAFPHYPPKGYDFCLVSRHVIDTVVQGVEKNTSIFALIVWANFESAAIPYERVARARGESHWSYRKMVRLALDSLISFSVLPVRLCLLGMLTVSVGLFAYLAFIFYGKLVGHWEFPAGWPSTMTIVLLTSAIQLLVLTIFGEYLWRTLDQTRGRPRFVISKRLGGDAGANVRNIGQKNATGERS